LAGSDRRRHRKNHAPGISTSKRQRPSLRECQAPGQFSVPHLAVEIPNRILVSEETDSDEKEPLIRK
jgi:hypothetical protein